MATLGSKRYSTGENKCLAGRNPLGKTRLCWRDETLVGKETSLGKTLRVREVIASSFTGDEKRGTSSFTGDEKVCILLRLGIRMPIFHLRKTHHRSTEGELWTFH